MKYGLSGDRAEENRVEDVFQMICHILEAPLLPEDPSLCLKNIPPEKRLNEFAFYYPLNKDAVNILADDCVFCHKDKYYILDWKTNHLGNDYQNYDPPSLVRHMSASLYDLQYHIYTVALHLYLKERVPAYAYQRDFGGVFYLFLRGVHSRYPGNGRKPGY